MIKNRIKKICPICNDNFEVIPSLNRVRFCSIKCKNIDQSNVRKGVSNKGSFKKGFIPWNKGLTKNNDNRLKSISEKSKEQMKREYENGIRNKFNITKNANKKCRELVERGEWILQNLDSNIRIDNNKKNNEKLKSEGRLGFQNYNVQLKARSICSSYSRGGSYIENQIKELLNELNIQYIEQYRINHPKLHNWYFIDFVIPNKRIAIECDGEEWHKNIEKDKYRQSIIEYYGWKVLRFSGNKIINNLNKVKEEILNIMEV